MADIANLKVGTNTYAIKDSTARTNASNAQSTANSAESKADQALLDSAEVDTKLQGTEIVGTYTSNTETLEISLEIGTVSSSIGT